MEGFYRSHYEEEAERNARLVGAVGGRRTCGQKVHDPEMGTVHIGGGGGAWTGMSYAPLSPEAKKASRLDLEAMRTAAKASIPRAPSYDAKAEERRQHSRLEAQERWEHSKCSALPYSENEVSYCRIREKEENKYPEAPFATAENNEYHSEKPRGKKYAPPPRSEHLEERVRGRARSHTGPATTLGTDQFDTTPGLMVSHGKNYDAFAIGNARAEHFVLRQRPSTRLVQTDNKNDNNMRNALNYLTSAQNAQIEDIKCSRRAVPNRPRDALSHQEDQALPRGRRHLSYNPKEEAEQDYRPSRRLFCTGMEAEPSKIGELEKFAQWYRTEYKSEPSREALEEAAKRIVNETTTQEELLPPVLSQAQAENDFFLWYTTKYGTEPPPDLISRAAAATFIPDNHAHHSEPKPRHHCLGNAAAPPEKHRGPRAGAIGATHDATTTKNTILGRSSTRVANPPGGLSSLSLDWN